MTYFMRVFCVAVIIGFCWLFGEPAILAFKEWWRKRQFSKLPPIEGDFAEEVERIWRVS